MKNAILERDGTTCRICGREGFLKRTGERYCEVHHMIELDKLAPHSLQSWNVLVLRPNCNKQFHYGNVSAEFSDKG